jgi:hypothetical protein
LSAGTPQAASRSPTPSVQRKMPTLGASADGGAVQVVVVVVREQHAAQRRQLVQGNGRA